MVVAGASAVDARVGATTRAIATAGPSGSSLAASTIGNGFDLDECFDALSSSSFSTAVNSSGLPVVAYYCRFPRTLRLSVCGDLTCSIRTDVDIESSAGSQSLVASLRLDRSDRPRLLYSFDNSPNARLAQCIDALCTSSTIIPIDPTTPALGNALRLDSADRVIIAWVDDDATKDLWIGFCPTAPCQAGTGTVAVLAGNAGSVGHGTRSSVSLDLGASGNPHLSFYDPVRQDLGLVNCTTDSCSSKTVTYIDSGGDEGFASSLLVKNSDRKVVAYTVATSASASDLVVVVCATQLCVGSATTTLDSAVWPGGVTMIMDGRERPLIAYRSTVTGEARMAICTDVNCADVNLARLGQYQSGGSDYAVSLSWDYDGVPLIGSSDEVLAVPRFLSCPTCVAPIRQTVDDSGHTGLYSSIELNSEGFPVISHYDALDSELEVAVCLDRQCKEATLTTVDPGPDLVGFYSSLALTSDNHPVITYWNATDDDLKMAICTDPLCTSPILRTIDGAVTNVGKFSSVALNSVGRPVVSYYDETNSALKIASCNDATCSSATIETVDGAAVMAGKFTSLALTDADLPVISYYDQTSKSLKLSVCTNPTCSAATLRTVADDSVIEYGEYNSLALDSQGFPVVSTFGSGSGGSLVLVTCSDATCSSPLLRTVEGGNVGRFSSLELTDDDLPVIAYLDSGEFDLKLATCRNASCSQSVRTTVDRPGSKGQYASLALDADGYPVISYYGGAGQTTLEMARFEKARVFADGFETGNTGGWSGAVPRWVPLE